MRTLLSWALPCTMLMVAFSLGFAPHGFSADVPSPAASGSSTNRGPVTAPIASLKFRSQGNRVMLPVTINGSKLLSFLLDSGYTITAVHPRLVESLNLRPAGQITIVGIAGEEAALTYAGAELRIGDVTYSPRRVAAVPSEAQRRRRRDGIIGAGLFQRYVVQLDFPGGVVRLLDPATYQPPPSAEIVPLRVRRGTPSVAVTFQMPDGKLAGGQFEVDTGCDDGLCLGRQFVVAQRLDSSLAADEDGVKRGVGGEARVRSGTIPTLRLGRVEARKVSTTFFQDGSPAGEGMAGHLGMGALRQFNVTFDYQHQRLILEPLRHP